MSEAGRVISGPDFSDAERQGLRSHDGERDDARRRKAQRQTGDRKRSLGTLLRDRGEASRAGSVAVGVVVMSRSDLPVPTMAEIAAARTGTLSKGKTRKQMKARAKRQTRQSVSEVRAYVFARERGICRCCGAM